ncbi:methyl-accepting chemotaxis protein [Spirulina subsalsa]|uniref:methyl-accepting chemotaxis protein n=1 Tax=Spirulina subsalsa TaxID=54311 RepID=UPI00036910FE|nr:methyl-accepting chemotaxis protein [Spirulina subsalsa]
MFGKLRLRQRILLGYFLPIVAFLLTTLWVASSTQTIMLNFNRVSFIADVIDKVHHLELAHLRMSNGTRGYLLEPESSFLDRKIQGRNFFQETVDLLNESQYSVDFAQQYFSGRDFDELVDLRQQYEKVMSLITQQEQKRNEMIAFRQQGNIELANQTFIEHTGEEINQEFQRINNRLHEMYQRMVLEEQQVVQQALGTLFTGFVFLAIIIGGGAGIALWWIATQLTRTIYRAARQILASTGEIATTLEQQASTASTQAASVNETTTTMDELTNSAQTSAAQAKAATHAAQEALALTEQGNQAVIATLANMQHLQGKVQAIAQQIKRLSEQNQQIGTIAQLVSNLSYQTNMLALNASVEAVRAGEYGKGFSVVATEIRKLADSSKQSAEQIHRLVGDIQGAIHSTVTATEEGTNTAESGIERVEETAKVFVGVQKAVSHVVESNQQIALNIQQQVRAVQQVFEAMSLLNRSSQDTAKGIEQTHGEMSQLNEAATALEALL